jgi:hypothetical protein
MLSVNGEFMLILDLHDTVFLSELVDIADSDVERRDVDGELYTICTTEMMAGGKIGWNQQAQKARWKSLTEKGYVKVKHRGEPGQPRWRWMCVVWDKITEDIKAAKAKIRE